MGPLLRKYHTRALFLLSATILLSYLFVTFLGNFFLSPKKESFQNSISQVFDQAVNIESIEYVFPLRISLKGIYIYPDLKAQSPELIFIKRLDLGLSFLQTLKTKKMAVVASAFLNTEFNYRGCFSFLKNNKKKVVHLIKTLPKDVDFKLIFKEAKLKVYEEASTLEGLGFNLSINKKDDQLNLSGNLVPLFSGESLETDTAKFTESLNLDFNLKALLGNNALILERIEIENKNFYLNLLGDIDSRILSLSGYARINDIYKEKKGLKTLLAKQTKDILGKVKSQVSAKLYQPNSFHVFDIDSKINLGFPLLNIDKIYFTLDNTPCNLTGNVKLSDSLFFDLNFSSFPDQVQNLRQKNTRAFDFKTEGILTSKASSGKALLSYRRKFKGDILKEEINLSVGGLSFLADKNLDFNLSLNEAKVNFKNKDIESYFEFKDLSCFYRPNEKRVKNIEFTSLIYDGILSGKLSIDPFKRPISLGLDFILLDLSSENFSRIVPVFSNIKGKLRLRSSLRNYRSVLKLNSEIVIEEGSLNKIEFFAWLSDFFKLPTLKEVAFDSLSADINLSGESFQLSNIKMNYQGVILGGYFKINPDDLISSIISLKLSRQLLKTSPSFRSLVRALGDEFSYLDFDFQLSGLYDAINFKWLDSRFKKSLKARIPDFFERGIEKRVENLIDKVRSQN